MDRNVSRGRTAQRTLLTILTVAASLRLGALAAARAPLPNAGEHGRLRIVGAQFIDEDGRPWIWRECSDFSLLHRYVRGDDLNELLADRIAAGCKVLRVFLSMENIAHVWPQEIPGFDGKVGALADLLAGRGLRLDAVALADAVNKINPGRSVMPELAAQQAFVARMVAVLTPRWNAFLSLCNECSVNGVDPSRFQRPPPPLLASRGSLGDLPPMPPWDWSEIHGSRNDDWPRDAKSSMDVRDGWNCSAGDRGCTPFPGTHNPVVQGEPMGAAETLKPGRRSAAPDDFAWFGATAALMGAGGTFHSDAGVTSTVYPPIQRASAIAFFQGLSFPPPDAQTRPYQRGCAEGGACIGNMPLDHRDAEDSAHAAGGSLRTYCRTFGSTAYCVAIRPGPAWRATPRDGWRATAEPRRGFVVLER